jgi:PD-(D/E)XK nuclease superfamily
VKIADDDPTTLVLHQSDIKHFLTCPEQFRVVNGIQPGGDFEKVVEHRVETDAATLGTVMHHVIEHELTGQRFVRADDAVRYAKNHMGELILGYIQDGTEYRTESFGENPRKSLEALERLVRTWFASHERQHWLALVNDHPGCVNIEYTFDVPFINGRPGRYSNIRLAGQMDVLDTYHHRVVDWKTTSRKYERWEKQRWDVQSNVYTYAAAQQGKLERHDLGYRFDFVVFNHKYNDPEPQRVEVWRENGSWGWLTQMVSNMVATIESEMEVYPLRDDHALCGPKWCPIWDSCKGTFVSHPEWK